MLRTILLILVALGLLVLAVCTWGSVGSAVCNQCGYSGGMTPLLDRDGKPVITTIPG